MPKMEPTNTVDPELTEAAQLEVAHARIRDLEEQVVAAQAVSHYGPVGLGVAVLTDGYGSQIAYRTDGDAPGVVIEFVESAHKRHGDLKRLARLRIALEAVVGVTLIGLAVMALFTPPPSEAGINYVLAPLVLVGCAATCVVAINRRLSQL